MSVLTIRRRVFYRMNWWKGTGRREGAMLMAEPEHDWSNEISLYVVGLREKRWSAQRKLLDPFWEAGRVRDETPPVLSLVIPRNNMCDCRRQERQRVVTLAAVCATCRVLQKCRCGEALMVSDRACRTCRSRRGVCGCMRGGGVEKWLGWCFFCDKLKNPTGVEPAGAQRAESV